MKHAKRTLAILLVTLLSLGMFAVGASAFAAPPITTFSESGPGQDAWEALWAEIWNAEDERLMILEVTALYYRDVSTQPSAYRAGRNRAGYEEAVEALRRAREDVWNEVAAVVNPWNDAALAANVANSNARTQINRLIAAEVAYFEGIASVARDFFIADAAAFPTQMVRLGLMNLAIDDANLTEAEMDAINNAINESGVPNIDDDIDLNAMFDNGEWTRALNYVTNFNDMLEEILIEFGVLEAPPPPSPSPMWYENLPAVLQFILRWLAFGWLWM